MHANFEVMEKNMKPVVIWLFTGCILIFIMTMVGGITRLTDSGLSMTDWNLIMGSVPPSTEAEWQATFEEYQKFPEYKLVHNHFTLSDFKRIFFWEYFHRMIGRFIGLVFIVPFIIFLIQGKIKGRLLKQCLILLGMGAFQGFLGWYMVKSGLVNEPRVSHYRLAAHLVTAFLTISYCFYVALSIMKQPVEKVSAKISQLKKPAFIVFAATVFQIIYGAFVAGRDAGKIHNFWPHMNPGEFISPVSFSMTPFLDNFIINSSGIQFVHRYMAFVVVFLVIWIWYRVKSDFNIKSLTLPAHFMLGMVCVQFCLGVFTLLFAVPLTLGVLHQLGALLLLLGCVWMIQRVKSMGRNQVKAQ